MSARLGWLLAAAGLAAGWAAYGWPGVALAVTVTVFWLLLQFNRAVRAVQRARSAPIGQVDSAVMLHAKLRAGMTLIDVLPLAGSLGEVVGGVGGNAASDASAETFRWRDAGDRSLEAQFQKGRLVRWRLDAPPTMDEPGAP